MCIPLSRWSVTSNQIGSTNFNPFSSLILNNLKNEVEIGYFYFDKVKVMKKHVAIIVHIWLCMKSYLYMDKKPISRMSPAITWNKVS